MLFFFVNRVYGKYNRFTQSDVTSTRVPDLPVCVADTAFNNIALNSTSYIVIPAKFVEPHEDLKVSTVVV